mgnify:CR=1 FL=1
MENANDRIDLDDLFTVEELAAKYPKVLSVPTLRWQLRHRDTNGLQAACVQIGKRTFISKARYEHWLAIRNGKAANA